MGEDYMKFECTLNEAGKEFHSIPTGHVTTAGSSAINRGTLGEDYCRKSLGFQHNPHNLAEVGRRTERTILLLE